MSSVHRANGKPNWFCYYSDHTGRRRCKSTGTADKKEATRICERVQTIEDGARTGTLTADRARSVIESTVSEIMDSIGSPIEQVTIREFFTVWIKDRELETSSRTQIRYVGIVKVFLKFMQGKGGRRLSALTAADVLRFRDSLVDRLASTTINLHVKVLRVALEKAVRENYFVKNPAKQVGILHASGKQSRRAFTLPELRKLLEVANEDWRTAILVGMYCGLRIGDICSLCWNNIDLTRKEITFTTAKTNRTQILPMHGTLQKHIESLPMGDDPEGPVCPSLYGRSTVSNQFYGIMAAAGLVPFRTNKKTKSGREAKRKLYVISFHALRHTATSLLKNAGVSNAVAMDLIGHESQAISANYTHVDDQTKRAAVDLLPDIFKA